MKLRQLVMKQPSKDFIKAPSTIRAPIEMTTEELSAYEDSAKASNVSLEPDGVSNPQKITSYELPTAAKTESGKTQKWWGRFIVSEK